MAKTSKFKMFEQLKKVLKECTLEKSGAGAGQHSASRVLLMFGLSVLVIYFFLWLIVMTGLGLNALGHPRFGEWTWSVFGGAMVEPIKIILGSALPYVANRVRNFVSIGGNRNPER